MGGICPQTSDSRFVQRLRTGDTPYVIDNTSTVVHIDVIPLSDEEKQVFNRLFPDYVSAIDAASAFDCEMLPSVELVNGKLKQFNDGMYAALEIALDEGLSKFQLGKAKWLQKICDKLRKKEEESSGFAKEAATIALLYVAEGLLASGAQCELPESIRSEIRGEPGGFTLPAGEPAFYSWTPKLASLYQQFRFFGRVLDAKSVEDSAAAALIAAVIDDDPELKAGMETILSLYQGVTNPADTLTVPLYARCVKETGGIENVISSRELAQKFLEKLQGTPEFKKSAKRESETFSAQKMLGMALIPLLRSKETDLYNRLWVQHNFMETLIAAIKSGKIDLKPDKDSGWYEYQQYALVPLLIPEKAAEAAKIQMSREYKKRLESAFKTIFAKTRDTHSGHLRPGLGCSAGEMVIDTIIIRPHLSVEPTATFYLRQARGYRFLLGVLNSCLGEEDLKKLKRLTEDKRAVSQSLYEELNLLMHLCYGFYAQSCIELGIDPAKEVEEVTFEQMKAWAEEALNFFKSIKQDKDLMQDTRILVHVGTMPQVTPPLNTMWATAGVKVLKIRVTFAKPPRVIDSGGYKVKFEPEDYFIVADEFLELETPGPLMKRADFRSLCDQLATKEAIQDYFAPGTK
jgi:hypothetical protein